jgi:hypothetical protein
MRMPRFVAAAAMAAGCFAAGAQAATYSFFGITNNNATNTAIGASQLFVEVTDPAGANNVLFTFRNVGPQASAITDVYFDDGTLFGIASIDGSAGVSFSQLASPSNLPGGNNASPPFVTTANFSADSDPPVAPNGVNPGEWLAIRFDLQSGQEYASVLSALGSGALRIGLHVQAFADGGSESFVNYALPVPEPEVAAFLLLGLPLVALVAARRRQNASVPVRHSD